MSPAKSISSMFVNAQVACCAWAIALMLSVSAAAPGTNQPPASASKQTGNSSAVHRVGVDEFEKLWLDKKNVVLDVRTKKEFDASHIPRARNLDVNAPDFDQKVSVLDKGAVYLVHCAAGVRSARACQRMSALGFTNLFDLAPGFRGWQTAGKTVEK